MIATAAENTAPSFNEAARTWAKIGLTSFGGPAGQIALMHRELVDNKKWLDEPSYLSALNFCMLLPGPEAMQLATYAGWRLHGVKGGLVAGLLFVMPGALLMLALSMLYGAYGNVPLAVALFTGIKAAVLAIVVEALIRISRRSLKDNSEWLIAGAAFTAIFLFAVPFPLIVLAAAIFGFMRASKIQAASAPMALPPVPWTQTLKTVAVWLVVWIVPLLLIANAYPTLPVFRDLALFFSKLAVVTFGGAYAVLAYVAQDGVNVYGWLKPGEMLDGLGLAETTPGPLILVNAFVGYLGAYRAIGGGGSVANGIIGWAIALWATFAPCFLWIFAGAPYIERLRSAPRLQSALSAVTAAVVGVVLNLSLWFALHVIFRDVEARTFGPLNVQVPRLDSIDMTAALIAILAAVLLFRFHLGVLATLAVCGAAALALAQIL